MVQVRWNDHVVAESDDVVEQDGWHFVPADTVDTGFLQASGVEGHSPTGRSVYFHVVADGARCNLSAMRYLMTRDPDHHGLEGRIGFKAELVTDHSEQEQKTDLGGSLSFWLSGRRMRPRSPRFMD